MELNGALTTLVGALEEIRSGTISPQAIATLSDAGQTLALIEISLNDNATIFPVAMAQPKVTTPVAQNNRPANGTSNAMPAPEGNLAPLNNAPAAATADIASSWSKNLPWIAIALVFLIITGLMVWLSRRDKKDLSPAAQ